MRACVPQLFALSPAKYTRLADHPPLLSLRDLYLQEINRAVPPQLTPGIQSEMSSLHQAVSFAVGDLNLSASVSFDHTIAHLIRLARMANKRRI
jgi:hypothetical protein